MGANHEAECSYYWPPCVRHIVSAILGAEHEAESGPITGDTGYSLIFDPAIL